jgi:hypothetical protein
MKRRQSDKGSIAIMMFPAVLVLFGLAALAVDVGFNYTRHEGLQAVVDAAALGGARGGISAPRAVAIADQNGYTNGVGGVTVTTTPSAGPPAQLFVRIVAPQVAFFSSIFSPTTRYVSAQATAVGVPVAPAILAIGSACGGYGVQLNGGPLTVTGNVASNGTVAYYVNTATTNGSLTYNTACGSPVTGGSTIRDGTVGGSGTEPDPFSATTPASFGCTIGTMTGVTLNPGPALTNNAVYCSGAGGINVLLDPTTVATVTFVSAGQITFNGNGGNLTARQNGIVAYSTASAAINQCPAGQAINIGNATITFNGSFYAPGGCINFSGNTMTINGSLIGNSVQINAGSNSVVNGAAGASTGSSFLQN